MGVKPDQVIPFTQADLLEGNRDMLDLADAVLANGTPRKLRAEITSMSGQDVTISLTTSTISEVDICVNDRPHSSVGTPGGVTNVPITLPVGEAVIRLEGFENGTLVGAIDHTP